MLLELDLKVIQSHFLGIEARNVGTSDSGSWRACLSDRVPTS